MKQYISKILFVLLLFCSPQITNAAGKDFWDGLGDFVGAVGREVERDLQRKREEKERKEREAAAELGTLDSIVATAQNIRIDHNYTWGWDIYTLFNLDKLSEEYKSRIKGVSLTLSTGLTTKSVSLNELRNYNYDFRVTKKARDTFIESLKGTVAEIKAEIQKKKDAEAQEKKDDKKKINDMQKELFSTMTQAATEGVRAEAKGKQDRESQAQMFTMVAQKLSDPMFVAGGIGATIAVIGGGKLAFDGAQLVIKRIKDALEQPDIISKSTMPANPWERLQRLLMGREEEPSRLDEFKAPNKELAEALPDLINEIRESHEAGVDLPNLLFYGPPGTGKTMFAEILAKETGKEYFFLSGSAFALCTEAQAVQKIKDMAAYMRAQEHGGIIFIDEAEIVFADRTYPDTSSLAKAITNEFLSLFPKPSDPKLMFIFCSNNAGAMDVAINSRISKSLAFVLPSFEAKLEIMCNYLKKEELELDNNLLPRLTDMKSTFEALSGRDIEDIVKDIARQVNASGKELNYELLTKAIHEKRNKIVFTQKERDKFQKARFGQQIDNTPLAAAAA